MDKAGTILLKIILLYTPMGEGVGGGYSPISAI